MNTEMSLSLEQEDEMRKRLVQEGFSIILEGIYVKNEPLTNQHRFGFQVFDPVARFEDGRIVLYLSDSHRRLIEIYNGAVQHGN